MEIEIKKGISTKVPKPRLARLIAKRVIAADLCGIYNWSCGMVCYNTYNKEATYDYYCEWYNTTGTIPTPNYLVIPNIYRFPFFPQTPLEFPSALGQKKVELLTTINNIIKQCVKEYMEEKDGDRN